MFEAHFELWTQFQPSLASYSLGWEKKGMFGVLNQ